MKTTTKMACNVGVRYALSICAGRFIGRITKHIIADEKSVFAKIVFGIGACVTAYSVGAAVDGYLNTLPPFKTVDGVVILDSDEE